MKTAAKMTSGAVALVVACTLGLSAGALEPRAGLSESDRLLFDLGLAQLNREWKPAPDTDVAFDGLGPLYIARSCDACHPGGKAGPGPRFTDDPTDRARRMAVAIEPADPVFGARIQPFGVENVPPEGIPHIDWKTRTTPDGTELAEPVIRLAPSPYGAVAADRALSGRVAPELAGLGLLALVPEDAIRANADPDDRDGDGISGRVSEPVPADPIGRFGWRAERVDLRDQIAHALFLDMGLSSATLPDSAGDCTVSQTACRTAPNGAGGVSGDTEAAVAVVDQMVDAVALAAMPRAAPRDPQGEALFARFGCAACHVPSLPVAGASTGETEIAAYTDLLLHDMGDGLAARDGNGTPRLFEWRTAPLWGMAERLASGTPGLLHDGRAASVAEAILWHGGEAETALGAY